MPCLKVHFYNPKKDTEGVWNKLVSYLDPPYCHCEIEFMHGLSCAVYIKGPVHLKTRQFDAAFYDCVPVACSAQEYHRALDYCTLRSDERQMFSLKLMLATKIVPLRFATAGTFCSKMCVEALQQAAVLPADINAALVTPSALHSLLSQPPPQHEDQSGVVPALDFV